MRTWIALLRGINVGGNNPLPMKELRELLEELGCADVRTYIQSGNAVFRSGKPRAAKLETDIAEALEARHGFRPRVLVLSLRELEAAIASNPYRDAEDEPKTLHLSFLSLTAHDPGLAALDALRIESERFRLIDRVFYLYAPEGIGRSKLAAAVEKHLGVATTSRNWRSVQKIAELARAL